MLQSLKLLYRNCNGKILFNSLTARCQIILEGYSDTRGQYKQAKSINYTITDASGAGLTGAKVAVYDNAGAIQDAIKTSF